MALQTIILRPIGQNGGAGIGGFTRVPSDTTNEDLYTLINEAVADDDATYIYNSGISANILLTFPLELLSGITPTAMRLVARVKSEGILWAAHLRISATDASGTEVASDTYAYNENQDIWETITADVGNFDGIKDLLADAEYSVNIYAEGSKSGGGYLTQLYLEVDYDDEAGGDEPVETPALYIKKSGAWEAVYGTVYNKVNGVWVEGDLSALSAGDKIIVEEL